MAPAAALGVKALIYLFAHREQIKQVIVSAEGLLGDQPGASRAAAVRNFIAQGMNEEAQIEGDIEKAWPFVGPFFDGFVAKVKKEAGLLPAPAAAT